MIPLLICFSALFSGLTLGLLGLDKIGLQIVVNGEDQELAEQARKIATIREDGNLLLCTLLLGNVAVNASLSILMANLTSGVMGFAISTIAIVIFGEIIPQALCSRYALYIGSIFVPLVSVLIIVLYIFTKPISSILDHALGDEVGTIHSRKELTELLKIHVAHGAMDVEAGNVAQGAIKYQDMQVNDVMSKLDDCYLLSADEILDFKKITEIFKVGFSRIPVYDNDDVNNVIGLLLVKDLIFVDPEDNVCVRNFIQIFGRSFLLVWPDQKLGECLRLFKTGGSHMALVRDVDYNDSSGKDPKYIVTGIVTLEDILEEIIGDEIIDETDEFEDNGSNRAGPKSRAERGFDYERLRLLDSGKLQYDKLTRNEAEAIGSHLRNNCKLKINNVGLGLTTDETTLLLNGCPVHDFEGVPNYVNNFKNFNDDFSPDNNQKLYVKGKTSDEMVLVLSGKLIVISGKENFRSEAGPWSILGAEALTLKDGEDYSPDFTAYIGSNLVRLIIIKKKHYQMVKKGEAVWANGLGLEVDNNGNSGDNRAGTRFSFSLNYDDLGNTSTNIISAKRASTSASITGFGGNEEAHKRASRGNNFRGNILKMQMEHMEQRTSLTGTTDKKRSSSADRPGTSSNSGSGSSSKGLAASIGSTLSKVIGGSSKNKNDKAKYKQVPKSSDADADADADVGPSQDGDNTGVTDNSDVDLEMAKK